MDQIRQIRYLIAPFFLFGWIVFGKWIQNPCWFPSFDPGLATIVVAAVAILPIGFLLNVISRFMFQTWIEHFKFADPKTPEQMRLKLHVQKTMDELQHLYRKPGPSWYLQATFDHGFMDKGCHEWVLRSWTGFLVSIDSLLALVLALGVGAACRVSLSWPWAIGTFVVSCLLFWNAKNCRQRCIDMIELQVWRRDSDKDVDPDLRREIPASPNPKKIHPSQP